MMTETFSMRQPVNVSCPVPAAAAAVGGLTMWGSVNAVTTSAVITVAASSARADVRERGPREARNQPRATVLPAR